MILSDLDLQYTTDIQYKKWTFKNTFPRLGSCSEKDCSNYFKGAWKFLRFKIFCPIDIVP